MRPTACKTDNVVEKVVRRLMRSTCWSVLWTFRQLFRRVTRPTLLVLCLLTTFQKVCKTDFGPVGCSLQKISHQIYFDIGKNTYFSLFPGQSNLLHNRLVWLINTWALLKALFLSCLVEPFPFQTKIPQCPWSTMKQSWSNQTKRKNSRKLTIKYHFVHTLI